MSSIARVRTIVAASAVAIAAVGGGCGAEQVRIEPVANSPRVALTVAYPGYAPWALITYRDARNRPCHAIGAITKSGPRVVDQISRPLAEALSLRGHCIAAADRDVSLQIRRGAVGGPRLVGGMVRRGVRRVVVAGQRITPRRDGTFLLALPPAHDHVGGTVGLEYRGGQRRRFPLDDVSS